MFATALIVFREALEAALIIGIVMAASRTVPHRSAIALTGAGAGIAGALLIAALAGTISEAASGVGQEILNASILGAAVLMLGWHNVWMSQHGREMAAQMKAVGAGIAGGTLPVWMLGSVIALAVLREGAEVVLFLFGIVAGGGEFGGMLVGGFTGLGAGVLVGAFLYFGMLKIPLRHFFTVTGIMILLLAAGLAAQCAGFLVQAGLIPAFGEQLWDTSWLIDEGSLQGQFLRALIGYVARPAGIQLAAYLFTLTAIGILMLTVGRSRRISAPAAAAAIATFCLVTLVSFTFPQPAHAAPFKVYSPRVVKGENEIEYRGYHDRDSDSSIDGGEKQVFAIGRGFTDYWFSELYTIYAKEPGGSLKHDAIEWENLFQLTEPGQYWADFGVLVEYEHPMHGDISELAVAPIIEKTFGPWVATGNFFFEREIGGGASSDTVFAYAARLKYLLHPRFEPAIEAFGEPGPIGKSGSFDHQEHWIGPAVYGQVGLGAKSKLLYSGSLQFGTTQVSSDQRFILRLEYEFF
jgi:FTR1 family protein